VTTPISNDNFSAIHGLRRQNPDAAGGRRNPPEAPQGLPTGAVAEHTDIGRAHRRLTQENTESAAPAIGSADEARHRATLIRQMITDSPASALKAHTVVDKDAVEQSMLRPAV
jgi:hypothetical protein